MDNSSTAFYGLFAGILLLNGAMFHFGGKSAERRFSGQAHQRIVFRERGASGHSKASLSTRIGGASRVLDVIVTEGELWIKGIWPAFSYIGAKYDLTHRVAISAVTKVQASDGKLELWFINEDGRPSHLELRLKDAAAFQRALQRRP